MPAPHHPPHCRSAARGARPMRRPGPRGPHGSLGTALRQAALAALMGAAAAPAAPSPVAARPATPDSQRWELASAAPLPGQAPRPLPWPAGTVLALDARALKGPAPLACAPAQQQLLRTPAQGLFEGSFAPLGAQGAAAAARALGLPGDGAAATLRIHCPNASFDLHLTPSGEALLALDGQVLRWRRADPVAAPPPGPQAAARQLLLRHLGGEPSFGADSIAALAPWLSPALQQRFARWLATPQPPDEVPALDGDPFTGSQEPPLTLAPGAAQPAGRDAARVPVRMQFEGGPVRTLHLLMRRQPDGRWQVDDIDYGRGLRLSMLLAQ